MGLSQLVVLILFMEMKHNFFFLSLKGEIYNDENEHQYTQSAIYIYNYSTQACTMNIIAIGLILCVSPLVPLYNFLCNLTWLSGQDLPTNFI